MLVFEQSDVNKDGKISYDEFLRVMTGFDYYLNLSEKEINNNFDYNEDCNNNNNNNLDCINSSHYPFFINDDDLDLDNDNDAINETCGHFLYLFFIIHFHFYFYNS
jgi:hypothetical protein